MVKRAFCDVCCDALGRAANAVHCETRNVKYRDVPAFRVALGVSFGGHPREVGAVEMVVVRCNCWKLLPWSAALIVEGKHLAW